MNCGTESLDMLLSKIFETLLDKVGHNETTLH
jgi:hypothetical protein